MSAIPEKRTLRQVVKLSEDDTVYLGKRLTDGLKAEDADEPLRASSRRA